MRTNLKQHIENAARLFFPGMKIGNEIEANKLDYLIDERTALYQGYISRSYEYQAKTDRAFLDGCKTDRLTIRRPELWVTFDKLGEPRPYAKTFPFPGEYITNNQAQYYSCPMGRMGIDSCIDIGIDGYLQKGDALKLYELAYCCSGDILEIGTHKGLSTSIIAQGLSDSGRPGFLITSDINAETTALAKASLANRAGESLTTFIVEDASKYMGALVATGRKFGFIFIDHWHGYRATKEAADFAKDLLPIGGFVLFHDFNDPSNADVHHVYGVYQAVLDSMGNDDRFCFYGVSGCCALFRKEKD